jgi:hypothetical protein
LRIVFFKIYSQNVRKMDDDRICEKVAKCPIYTGILEANPVLIQTYKNLYCENGKSGREKCKRYQVSSRVGYSPPDLLPNSQVSVEDIIRKMEQKQ